MGIAKRIIGTGLLSAALVVSITATAFAHVVVQPNEVKTGARVSFAVSVPNEHDSPVVGVRLLIPEGLESVRPYAKTGWTVEVVKTGEGEDVTATEIKWTSAGATVPVDLKDDFMFGAKAPADTTELKWKAYETYGDGSVVAWEQEPSEAEGNKPYSVTKVVTETAAEAGLRRAEQAAADADKSADQALYVAIAAILLGLVGIILAVRKPSSGE